MKELGQQPQQDKGIIAALQLDQSGQPFLSAGQPYKIRFAHPKGVFRFKTFEEMDAWDAIYKVPIRVK